jgi:hypothetical protein
MTSRLKHINPLQFGIVCGALYFLMGIIFALCFAAIIGMVASIPMAQTSPNAAMMTPVTAIFLPFFYGIFGFLGGIIFAWLYNVVAGWTGGVEVRVDSVSAPYQAAVL